MAARLAVLPAAGSDCCTAAETGGVRSSCLAAVETGVVSGMFVLRSSIASSKNPERGGGGIGSWGKAGQRRLSACPGVPLFPHLRTCPTRQTLLCSLRLLVMSAALTASQRSAS